VGGGVRADTDARGVERLVGEPLPDCLPQIAVTESGEQAGLAAEMRDAARDVGGDPAGVVGHLGRVGAAVGGREVRDGVVAVDRRGADRDERGSHSSTSGNCASRAAAIEVSPRAVTESVRRSR